MSFSDQLSRIKNKLRENADYYPTKSIKLAYVKGLIGGEAAKHISLQLRDDAVDLYTTVQDLFEHLTSTYKNLNRVFIAKNKFKKLFMKSTQSFYKFYTKFLQLASEAKVIFAELKYKLNSKLSFALQKAIISHFNTESTFYKFAKQYTIYN